MRIPIDVYHLLHSDVIEERRLIDNVKMLLKKAVENHQIKDSEIISLVIGIKK